MSNEQDYIIIENYLLGKLSESEKKSFEERCLSDNDFNQLFLDEKNLFDAIEVEGNHQMKAVLQNLESQHQAKIIRMSPRRKLLRLIAGFLFFPLCFFLFKTLSSNSSEDLFVDNFTIYPNELVDIERGTGESSQLKATMIDYSNGDFTKAIQGFDEILKKGRNENILFYKGLSYLGSGDAKTALKILEDIGTKPNFKFEEAIHWYLALAYIKENNHNKAKNSLEKIISSGQSFRAQSAQKLLLELNK